MARSRRHSPRSSGMPQPPRPRSGREPIEEWRSAADDAGVPLEQLMREVAHFRVALDADMTIAAAAAELGEDALAADILGAEREHLADFEVRALRSLHSEHADAAGGAGGAAGTRRRLTPVAPAAPAGFFRTGRTRMLAAAAAAAVIITGLGTAASRSDHRPQNQTATLALAAATRYADFTRLASGDVSAQQMIAAAAALHDSLADLIMKDPTAASQVATILTSEQQQLLRYLPPGTTTVLRDARALVARLSKVVPSSAAKLINSVDIESPPPSAAPANRPANHPTSSGKPSPRPTSTSPASVPQPSATPQPATSSSPHPSSGSTPSPNGSPSATTPPIFPGTGIGTL